MGHWVDKSKGETVTFKPTTEMQAIIAHCETAGFVIRKNTQCCDRCSATHVERGVKFSIDQTYTPPYHGAAEQVGDYNITVTASVKSVNDTWIVPNYDNDPWKESRLRWSIPHAGAKITKPASSRFCSAWLKPDAADLQRLMTDMDKFLGASVSARTKKDKTAGLYEPLLLDAHFLQEKPVDTRPGANLAQKKPGIQLCHFFNSAVVLGFAVIQEDLFVNDQDSVEPDADAWFHLAVTTDTATPHVLVREREDKVFEYYPARKAGKRYRVCKDTTPSGTYIDFTKATKLDAMLFEAAISKFLAEL